jgi:hypothetical protein
MSVIPGNQVRTFYPKEEVLLSCLKLREEHSTSNLHTDSYGTELNSMQTSGKIST